MLKIITCRVAGFTQFQTWDLLTRLGFLKIVLVLNLSVPTSLRSKRFSKAFRTFDALFAFLAAAKLGRAQKVCASVLRSPQFLRSQKAKNASNGRKALRKRLLRRLCPYCRLPEVQYWNCMCHSSPVYMTNSRMATGAFLTRRWQYTIVGRLVSAFRTS